jgi:hypothetical protein
VPLETQPGQVGSTKSSPKRTKVNAHAANSRSREQSTIERRATIFVKESSKTSTLELLPQQEDEAVAETSALVAHGGTDTITRKTVSGPNL